MLSRHSLSISHRGQITLHLGASHVLFLLPGMILPSSSTPPCSNPPSGPSPLVNGSHNTLNVTKSPSVICPFLLLRMQAPWGQGPNCQIPRHVHGGNYTIPAERMKGASHGAEALGMVSCGWFSVTLSSLSSSFPLPGRWGFGPHCQESSLIRL